MATRTTVMMMTMVMVMTVTITVMMATMTGLLLIMIGKETLTAPCGRLNTDATKQGKKGIAFMKCL